MAENSKANGANNKATARTVVNPYTQKKKSPPQKNPYKKSASFTNVSPVATTDLPATSFSQAFSSVEETQHYKNEMSNWQQLPEKNRTQIQDDMKEQAEQRAFDAAAAAATSENTAQQDAEANMTDREHHVMLQPHVLHVSTKQRGNGVLKFIRNVPFAYSKMVPDYIMSTSRCALFLSCKYHNLYPNYIHRRIAELKSDFVLRALLVLVDVEDNANILRFLNKLAVTNNMTLILAWSEEEAARYLETYKAYDGKDASSIQRREQTNFSDQVADVLGTVRSVNKTDSAQLLEQFGSIKSLVSASIDELSIVHGMGDKKVRRLYDAFHKPFSSLTAKKRKADQQEKANSPAVDPNQEEQDKQSSITTTEKRTRN